MRLSAKMKKPMGKKQRIRHTPAQKIVYNHLLWYTQNKINWVGDGNLKEAALDGSYAVFSIRGDPYKLYAEHWDNENIFDTLIMTETMENARAVVKWNYDTHARVVDLKWMQVMLEMKRMWRPMSCLPDEL